MVGVHGQNGAAAVRALRQDELPAALALRGDGEPERPRLTASDLALTDPDPRLDPALHPQFLTSMADQLSARLLTQGLSGNHNPARCARAFRVVSFIMEDASDL